MGSILNQQNTGSSPFAQYMQPGLGQGATNSSTAANPSFVMQPHPYGAANPYYQNAPQWHPGMMDQGHPLFGLALLHHLMNNPHFAANPVATPMGGQPTSPVATPPITRNPLYGMGGS